MEKVSYVGGLDSSGLPHGIGAWHDTHKEGELLVGCEADSTDMIHVSLNCQHGLYSGSCVLTAIGRLR